MAKRINIGVVDWVVNGLKVITKKISKSSNYNNLSSRIIKYVVMHYTGNKKDTAQANANYFATGSRGASAHFFVDDDSIHQSVELRDTAWHCGAKKYYHNDCRNANSIGIEMCCTAGNYKVSKITQINAAYLCAKCCQEIGISSSEVDTYVLRHYDVTHKRCPAQYVENESEWIEFKNMVKDILNGGLRYKSHVQTYGWEKDWCAFGETSGTVGEAKRMEAIIIEAPSDWNLTYQVHCQTYGDMPVVKAGEVAGTVGKAKRMESIKIDADVDIMYRIHQQTYGWSKWYTNGEWAGVKGKKKRLEAIEIKRA